MTKGTGEIVVGGNAGQDAAGGAVRDWEAVRASDDIQFAPVELPEAPEPPGWLQDLIDFLQNFGEALGVSGTVFVWALLGVIALFLLYVLWRLAGPVIRARFERGVSAEEAAADWTPDRTEAMALLDDADRLAAEGRFDEATHLLLQRSVGQIAAARPGWLEPSSTAREIATLAALPDKARSAFATIAERVERSLFALRRLEEEDWNAARAAYADFALADLAAGNAG